MSLESSTQDLDADWDVGGIDLSAKAVNLVHGAELLKAFASAFGHF